MASHNQATPIPSVDNEPHHDDGEDVYDVAAAREYLAGRIAAATQQHHHNDNLAIDETRPRALGSPFRTPSPSSCRGSTSTKRSQSSMEDDDGSTPVPARPHQRVRHNSHSPIPQLQGDPDFHPDWQAAALAPVRQQPPGIEYTARQVLPFNGFLQQSGLDREALERGVQVAAPPNQQHLRRATFDFAVPAPFGRENRRLPSPRPGPEHFPGDFAAAAPPPSPPAGRPGYLALQPLPALHHYQQAGYYHLGQELFQPAPPPPPPRRWLAWPDMSAGHREAWWAVVEW